MLVCRRVKALEGNDGGLNTEPQKTIENNKYRQIGTGTDENIRRSIKVEGKINLSFENNKSGSRKVSNHREMKKKRTR